MRINEITMEKILDYNYQGNIELKDDKGKTNTYKKVAIIYIKEEDELSKYIMLVDKSDIMDGLISKSDVLIYKLIIEDEYDEIKLIKDTKEINKIFDLYYKNISNDNQKYDVSYYYDKEKIIGNKTSEINNNGQGSYVWLDDAKENKLKLIIEEKDGEIILKRSVINKFVKVAKIPDGVTIINNVAFMRQGIMKISIPSSVKEIGEGAFMNTDLREIIIPPKVSIIKAATFDSCVKLETVYLPKGIAKIEEMAFSACRSLKDVYYAGTEEDWKKITIEEANKAIEKAAIHFKNEPKCS